MSDSARPRRQRPQPTATQRALVLLTRREHSRKELSRKLTARGVDQDEVTAAVDKLSQAGWQDDARFAEALVRSRAGAGYGPLRIRAELRTHGLDRDAVAAAMETVEIEWVVQARDLIRRRFGPAVDAADRALQRKAADFLIRRGFASDHVRAVTCFSDDE